MGTEMINENREEFDFHECDEIGKIGEKLAFYIMKDLGFSQINNVSEDKAYQEIDVDFTTQLNNEETWVEVKGDATNYENLFYETISNEESKTLGCMRKTKAQILFYLFLREGRTDGYILQIPGYKGYVDPKIKDHDYVIKPVYNKDKKTHKMKKTWGYSIPIAEIEGFDWIKRIDISSYKDRYITENEMKIIMKEYKK